MKRTLIATPTLLYDTLALAANPSSQTKLAEPGTMGACLIRGQLCV